jgi:hypothetical protein
MALADLLGLADAEDQARWAGLRLSYTDPLGTPWLRASIAKGRLAVARGHAVFVIGRPRPACVPQ